MLHRQHFWLLTATLGASFLLVCHVIPTTLLPTHKQNQGTFSGSIPCRFGTISATDSYFSGNLFCCILHQYHFHQWTSKIKASFLPVCHVTSAPISPNDNQNQDISPVSMVHYINIIFTCCQLHSVQLFQQYGIHMAPFLATDSYTD